MLCPNCGAQFQNANICPKCGADYLVFKKVQNAAIKLYNKGLEQAKSGEISSAIESLEKCVQFDKTNVSARNLLGLVYFEAGLVADALKQWIISASKKREKNPAQKYISAIQNNGRELEKYSDSLNMYNSSLAYIKQGDLDLAIIQLKKATEFNPKFIMAQNLLSLCYINTGDVDNAINRLEKTLKIDKNNATALKYMEVANRSNKGLYFQKKEKSDGVPSTGYRKKVFTSKGINIFGKGEIISFFVGAVLTAAVLVTLILPSMDEGKAAQIAKLETQLKEVETRSVSAAGSSNEELAELNTQLKQENEMLKQQIQVAEKSAKIDQAYENQMQGNDEAAADIILQVDPTNLGQEYLDKYNSIKAATFTKVAKDLYENAKTLFINNNYTEAQYYLDKCLLFATDEEFVDDAIYYLAKIAESNSDFAAAKSYYETIVNTYPTSNQIKDVENSLSKLAQQ